MATKTKTLGIRPNTSPIRIFNKRETSSRLKDVSPQKKIGLIDNQKIINVPIKKTGVGNRRVTRQQTGTAEKTPTREKDQKLDPLESNALSGLNKGQQKVPTQKDVDSGVHLRIKKEVPTEDVDSGDDMASDNEEDSFIKLITNRSPAKFALRDECPIIVNEQPEKISKASLVAASAKKNVMLKKQSTPLRKMASSSLKPARTAKPGPTKPINPHVTKNPQNELKTPGTKNLISVSNDIKNNFSSQSVQKSHTNKNRPFIQPNIRISQQTDERRVNNPNKDHNAQQQTPKTRHLVMSTKSCKGLESEPQPLERSKPHQVRLKDEKNVDLQHPNSIARPTRHNPLNHPAKPSRDILRTRPSNVGHVETQRTQTARIETSPRARCFDKVDAATPRVVDHTSPVPSKSTITKTSPSKVNTSAETSVAHGRHDTSPLESKRDVADAEAVAKAVRAEAAERGRRAAQEWAERQAAKQKLVRP
ncbi:hypothetical protein K3495_g1773 [Podosphaera aphanis]|nr:hypothetical protein K3495_g1773 [Podosphaera aphanis]